MNALSPREAGLAAVARQEWNKALIYLNLAARQGQRDPKLLDALGEAAYKTDTPEALGPYQNYYKYPTLATLMARAFLMLGDLGSCREFLSYAQESPLKEALIAMTEMGSDVLKTASHVVPVAEKYPHVNYPEYWRALAAVADAVGREDLVRLAERRSKAMAYADPNIHFNQALRMLGKGEFRAGWRLYEWRLVPGAAQNNRTQLGDLPMWEGESLKGKKLLLFLEQGLGDTIFGLRYIRLLESEGAHVQIVARKSIIPLAKESFPEHKIHDEDEVAKENYWDGPSKPDFWVYALSVPALSGQYEPYHTGKYLKASTSLTEEYRQKIKSLNQKNLPVAVINWHGRIETDADRTRAYSIAEFISASGLLEKPHFLISVQKDAKSEEVSLLQEVVEKSGGDFFDAAPMIENFGHTAAWITASDRLVTCDTSVAHVGGGLGHPTTVLARNKAIWQWFVKDRAAEGGQSIWYDCVNVQYALTPEISWLFTTIKKSEHSAEPVVRFSDRFRFASRHPQNKK